MALEILTGILYLLLGLLGTVLFLLAFLILLPVVVRVEAARAPDPEAAPQVQACVGPWYGVVAVTLVQLVHGWEARLLLFGRFCIYRRRLEPDDEEDTNQAESTPAESSPAESSPADTGVADVSVAGLGRPDPGPTGTPHEEAPSNKADEAARPASLRERLSNGWRDVRVFLPPVRRLLRGLLRVVSLRRLEIDATLAGEDAAQTGLLYGRAQALRPFAPSWTRIRIDADFLRTTPYGQAKVHLHLYLARLLGSIGRFGLSAGRVWLIRWWRLRRAARTLSSSAMTERK